MLNVVLNLDLQFIKGRKREHLNNMDKLSSTEACSHQEGKALMHPFLPGKHCFDSSILEPWSDENKMWLCPVAVMCLWGHTGVSKDSTGTSEPTCGMGELLPEMSSAPSKHSTSVPFSCCYSPPPPSQKNFSY